jgi:serine protease Do
METQQLGVLVEDVVPDSVAWDRGISPGSVILRVDEQPVSAPADVEGCIDDARRRGRDLILLLIEDSQGRHWTAVPLKSAS